MRFSIVQFDIVWEIKQDNLVKIEKLLSGITPTDVIVLPEMFSTGFSMQSSILAESMDGTTIHWMRSIAKQYNAAITGSLIIQENDRYFNRLLWVNPDGTLHYYDKRHLFGLGQEHEHYSPGNNRFIVEYQSIKILPLICYDLRFPVWSRNTDGYDVLIYVANFPAVRSHAWNSLLKARAIENQAFTIGVNRIGNDGNGIYHQGDSCCIDYLGNTLCHFRDIEACHTIELSLESQLTFREKFPFLKDKDEFTFV